MLPLAHEALMRYLKKNTDKFNTETKEINKLLGEKRVAGHKVEKG